MPHKVHDNFSKNGLLHLLVQGAALDSDFELVNYLTFSPLIISEIMNVIII